MWMSIADAAAYSLFRSACNAVPVRIDVTASVTAAANARAARMVNTSTIGSTIPPSFRDRRVAFTANSV